MGKFIWVLGVVVVVACIAFPPFALILAGVYFLLGGEVGGYWGSWLNGKGK